ncbi:hypothetical protein XENORESO_003911 [Xenotaenia resolanae]|uniref:Uncharacterized protein n=1 Tax=Xenotaenia resolanae TaxID=208358 RepID=A0ABV0X1M8_9TELE
MASTYSCAVPRPVLPSIAMPEAGRGCYAASLRMILLLICFLCFYAPPEQLLACSAHRYTSQFVAFIITIQSSRSVISASALTRDYFSSLLFSSTDCKENFLVKEWEEGGSWAKAPNVSRPSTPRVSLLHLYTALLKCLTVSISLPDYQMPCASRRPLCFP